MQMRIFLGCLIVISILSCGKKGSVPDEKIITVSIPPFKYFVSEIAGDDFKINVMVPAGSNPHIYEPFPEQINNLRRSVAYISNGYLGFEMTWLDRFYETNKTMKRLSLGDRIDPLEPEHEHAGGHVEAADPHYWVSPKCALIFSMSLYQFLCELNPPQKQKYTDNFNKLVLKIKELDKIASGLFSGMNGRSFMIFHPNLGYLARDYGLEEISVEYEGKEPPPSRMKELIDKARVRGLKTIFVQREYDTKNAKAIANEIGASVVIIDPLSEDWYKATSDMITALNNSLTVSSK
jgi:zinc transport system substrate-binding protein